MAKEEFAKAQKISDDYHDEEFPPKFREFVLQTVYDRHEFVLRTIHDILLSDMKRGGKMLDFGCGPFVNKSASASRHYEEIFLGDYSDSNRRQLEKWVKGDSQYLDWEPLLNVVAKLEGFSDVEDGVRKIEKRIRSSVKKIIPCDILASPPISEEFGNFDLIVTVFCLELVCTTDEMFKSFVEKLSLLIKPGGTLIMATILERKSYTVHKDLHVFPINEALVRASLEECGLKLNVWRIFEKEGDDEMAGFRKIVTFSAEKCRCTCPTL